MAPKSKKQDKPQLAEWMYTIIRRPVVTEKSTRGSEANQVTFEVLTTATKPQIKAAVEALYSVKVKAVNTLRVKGKTKVFKGVRAVRSDTKKAMISLEPGQTIDVGTGV